MSCIGPAPATDEPPRSRQVGGNGLKDIVPPALAIALQSEIESRSVAPSTFIEDGHIVLQVRARPVPIVEPVLERLVAEIGIEVSGTRPAHAWMRHFNFDMSAGRDGMPAVKACGIKHEGSRSDHFRRHPHGPPDPVGKRSRNFIDVDDKSVAVPTQRAWTDGKMAGVAIDPLSRALGHRPRATPWTVERHVQGAVIARPTPPAELVVGRENTADKGDNS